jgi:predicted phosphohydrolase
MSIYAIGDLHLSAAAEKPMDIFSGWEDHTTRIAENWRKKIKPEDTVVLAGDTSWGMSLAQAVPDFELIHELPGTKLLLKGNHDYWWSSAAKMNAVFAENGLTSLRLLHNSSYEAEGVFLCGSRGWLFETGEPHDEKLIRREAMRIAASIRSSGDGPGERILFLHYPPIYNGQRLEAFMGVIRDHGIRRCYYGHIHGAARRHAIQGLVDGCEFTMISADYLGFDPVLVK